MIKFPPCKINLGLHVVEKRNDGFHNIETIFYPLPLTDALEVIPAPDGKTEFTQSGISIPSDGKKNLCERAYDILKEGHNIPPVKIHLHKHIPTGAGLGGGSSDAAFTLLILNDLFELGIQQNELLGYAAQLGSDCSFFIINKPCLASGRGEILKPLQFNLKGIWIVLVKPQVHVNTTDAYAGIKPEMPAHKIEDIVKLPMKEWKYLLVNDFEKTVFVKSQVIGQIKDKLYESGATYACMSGSGATVFGLFEKEPGFDADFEFKDCFTWKSEL